MGLLQKPFLLINSPVFLAESDQVDEIQRDEITDEISPHRKIELENKVIENVLIKNQLRFLARNNRFSRPLKIKLNNSDQIIGHISLLEGSQVIVEANGTKKVIDGNDIIKIEKL